MKRIAALEDAFNNCIESLLKYCSLRQRFLTSFGIGFPGVETIFDDPSFSWMKFEACDGYKHKNNTPPI